MDLLPKDTYLLCIFPYLSYREQLNFASTHRFIYDKCIHETRQVFLCDDTKIMKFFFNENYRNKVYSKISNPGKQLNIQKSNEFLHSIADHTSGKASFLGQLHRTIPYSLLSKDFIFPNLRVLNVFYEDFLFMCEYSNGSSYFTVESLTLSRGTYALLPWIQPHLHRATKELHLSRWVGTPLKNLNPSLEVLKLNNCDRIIVSSLPNLRVLNIDGITSVEGDKNTTLPLFPKLKFLDINGITSLENLYELIGYPHRQKIIIENCSEFVIDVMNYPFHSVEVVNSVINNYLLPFSSVRVLDITLPEGSHSDDTIDLSLYPNIRRFSLNANYNELTCALLSKLPSSSLKIVSLYNITDQVELSLLQNLYFLRLEHCSFVTSLFGLGNVHTIELNWLEDLRSLKGLGPCNRNVSIRACSEIFDFTPLKYVHEVKLIYCLGFVDASQVDHVHTLTVIHCQCLHDVSKLGGVQRLTLESCNRIPSLKGLENVPELRIFNCRHIKQQANVIPIYMRDFGIRIIADRLTSLPDSLYPTVLSFLDQGDAVRTICSNCYLYQRSIRRIREITVQEEDNVLAFFSDELYRHQLVSRLNNPSEQLIVDATPYYWGSQHLLNHFDSNFTFPYGLKELLVTSPFFIAILKKISQGIPIIQSLVIPSDNTNNYNNNDEGEEEESKIFDHANTSDYIQSYVKKRLILQDITLPLQFHLPNTIEELEIKNCSTIEYLTPCPKLSKLKLYSTLLLNIASFNYLNELELTNLLYLEDISSFNHIKKLILINCRNIKNYQSLQNNDEIHITLTSPKSTKSRNNILDFRSCFMNSRKISIYADQKALSINLIDYEKLTHFSLRGALLNIEKGQLWYHHKNKSISNGKESENTDDNTYYEALPPKSLKVLSLQGILNLAPLTKECFQYINKVELNDCRGVFITSCNSISTVPYIKLKYLPNLISISELTDHVKVIELHSLNILFDFTPLKNIPTVLIEGCLYLKKVEGWDGIISLTIKDCPNLITIQTWSKLEYFEVRSCDKLQDIGDISRISGLKIENCRLLEDMFRR